MPGDLMLTLPLLLTLLAGQTCTPVTTTPLAPTIVVYGDSRMVGNLCGSTSPVSPPAYLDANLGGGTAGGVLVVNAAVSGTTPAQQRAAYENVTTGESKACRGERCGHMLVGGVANCLRAGTAAATCLADHTWMVDDARSKGVAVVWFNETDYSEWDNAGANPTVQVEDFNAAWSTACNARAATDTRVKCVDIFDGSGNPLTQSCDGIHLNQTGTNRLGGWLLAAFLSIS